MLPPQRPAMELTVHDVLKFHRPDCAAYDHLLALGAGREPARDAVALLMWLQSAAYIADEAASRVPIMVRSRGDAERIVAEARAVLLGAGEAASLPTQAMASLCGADASRVRGILAHAPTNVVRSGVAEVVAGVGALVFDDRLRELMWRYEAAGGRGALPPELAAPYRSCSASETPEPQQQEEEDDGCSLFVTFSKGEQPPWTREEIEVCIAEMWGDFVERVMMEKMPPGEPPLYARVVLCSATAVEAILGEQPLAKLVVNGRQLWVRKYVPQSPPQH